MGIATSIEKALGFSNRLSERNGNTQSHDDEDDLVRMTGSRRRARGKDSVPGFFFVCVCMPVSLGSIDLAMRWAVPVLGSIHFSAGELSFRSLLSFVTRARNTFARESQSIDDVRAVKVFEERLRNRTSFTGAKA